jgi:uncharacterized membrane protein YdjX (TVP38/TMEM64 family)
MKNIIVPILISIAFVSIVFVSFENLEVYFQSLLNHSQNHTFKYSALSFIVLAGDIVLPVPSSIVMYSNGLVVGWVGGALLSFVSVFVSSTIGFYIGRFSTKKERKGDKKVQLIIKKYGALSIVLTRGVPILSESICFTAGYNKMSIKAFTILNLIGYAPICIIYAFFGSLGVDENLFLISFVSSIVLSALLWFFGKKIITRLVYNI